MSSKERTHIIYLPGLGDGYDHLRKMLLRCWMYKNITVELVPMQWTVDDGYDTKMKRVEVAIDHAIQAGKRVVIIGESAGGSMAVNVYAARTTDISRVVTLCGKNTHPETVSPRLYSLNPTFKESMYATGASLQALDTRARSRFTSIHPIFDPVVPIRETFLDNCRKVQIMAYGHLVPIILLLSVFSFITVREARRSD